ncbi:MULTISPECIES: STAS domain-containing protein [Actinomadura]|jgi:anti-anti-sigma factor|uniref:Anti-sigma factor antagonist n=1 Tax=Actinomadura montaniterrae TaxID=1803903 RepID=A0A6L3W1Z6_9ACTN|nr:STAS domain-containing protein [Actinomadura montaniterrae]KAB2380691.1 STAS domain-containing protein [Actinomadura montaniterrae]
MKDTAVAMVVIEHERHTTVLLTGEMDRASAPAVRTRLLDFAARPIVLDIAGVSFFDAEGMRAVSHCARRCEDNGAGLAVVGARPFARRMFHVLGLDQRVPLCASMDEALWCAVPRTDDEISDWLA